MKTPKDKLDLVRESIGRWFQDDFLDDTLVMIVGDVLLEYEDLELWSELPASVKSLIAWDVREFRATGKVERLTSEGAHDMTEESRALSQLLGSLCDDVAAVRDLPVPNPPAPPEHPRRK